MTGQAADVTLGVSRHGEITVALTALLSNLGRRRFPETEHRVPFVARLDVLFRRSVTALATLSRLMRCSGDALSFRGMATPAGFLTYIS